MSSDCRSATSAYGAEVFTSAYGAEVFTSAYFISAYGAEVFTSAYDAEIFTSALYLDPFLCANSIMTLHSLRKTLCEFNQTKHYNSSSMLKWKAANRLLRQSSKALFSRSPSITNSQKSINTITQLEPYLFTYTDHQQSLKPITTKFFSSISDKLERNPSFATINSDDIRYFKEILGEKNVVEDEEVLLTANTDWMGKYKGASKLMLQPRNTDEVSQILKYCDSRCLAVVPQGGNTGLVGGSVPVFDEVIVNVGLMNNIISLDKISGIMVCEAGCILENLISFLDNQGFTMPLDLGAKGSCQIGGNISTNAGGLRLVRYGSLHGTVLGLEVVLANGTVLDMLGTLRKDNTGYDLKHLFIGSEGSLGIVTKVSLLTPPKLSSVNLAFLACSDYLSCQSLLVEAKRKLGEILSAFEFLDNEAMDLVLKHLDGARNPLPPSIHKFYVLIETTGSDESSDKAKLEAFLLHSMEDGFISDGVLAQDISQASSFWHIREGVSEALRKAGAVYKYDFSLPVEKMYDLVEKMRTRIGQSAKVIGYGHLGDGNLHLNISAAHYDDAILAKIEPFVYEWTAKNRGSISAEHGLGLMKANKIHYSKSAEAVQLMASIKMLMDPNGILNPYKVLPVA